MELIPSFTKRLERFCATSPLLIKLMNRYYQGIVKREVALGKISKKDAVLCIGGGPLPCTAIEIAHQTGAQVQVVDIDPQAVRMARQVIERLNMSNRIKVIHTAGQAVDASRFTVVHVALQAHPHEEILKHIFENAPKGARILMRSPKSFLENLYNYEEFSCPCAQCNQIKQRNLTMKSTLLFTKEAW